MSDSKTTAAALAEYAARKPRCAWCETRIDYANDSNACAACSRVLTEGRRPTTNAAREQTRARMRRMRARGRR